jgi:hypothetical protein
LVAFGLAIIGALATFVIRGGLKWIKFLISCQC